MKSDDAECRENHDGFSEFQTQSKSSLRETLPWIGILIGCGIAFWAYDRFFYLQRLSKKGAEIRYVQPDDWESPVPYFIGLDGPEFSNSDLRRIQTLATVEELDLSSSSIDDAALGYLAGLPRLKVLDLSDTPVTGRTLHVLAKCPRLRELALNDCRHLDVNHLTQLRNVRTLDFLSIFGCPCTLDELIVLDQQLQAQIEIEAAPLLPISAESPFAVSWYKGGPDKDRLFSLQEKTETSSPMLTAASLKTIPRPGRIGELSLATPLSSALIQALPRFSNLRSFKYRIGSDTSRLQGIEQLLSLPQLIGLHCDAADLPREPPSAARKLSELSIQGDQTPEQILLFLNQCPNLEVLEIVSPVNVPQLIDAILKLAKLKELAVWNCSLGNDDLLRILDLPQLRSVRIHSDEIDSEIFHHLTRFENRIGIHLVGTQVGERHPHPTEIPP